MADEQPTTITREANGSMRFGIPTALVRYILIGLVCLLGGAGGMAALKGVQPTQVNMPPEFSKLLERMALSEADRATLHEADRATVEEVRRSVADLRSDMRAQAADLKAQTDLIMQLMQRLPLLPKTGAMP